MKHVKGYIFDYGGTLDTGGDHWGKVLWHSYERLGVPVGEQQFRDAYVHAERTLGSNRIIMSDFTFRQTLHTKIRLQLEWLSAKSLPVSIDTHAKVLTDDVYTRTQQHTAHSREVLTRLKEQYPREDKEGCLLVRLRFIQHRGKEQIYRAHEEQRIEHRSRRCGRQGQAGGR